MCGRNALVLIAQQIKSDRTASSTVVAVDSPDSQPKQNEAMQIVETKSDSIELDVEPEILVDEIDSEEFSVDNSEEYWALMMESFSLRANALREKSQLDGLSKGEQMMMLAESFEMQAKVVEADLNLKRIKSKAKSAQAKRNLRKKLSATAGSTNTARRDELMVYSNQSKLPDAKIPPASSDPVTPGEILLVEILNNPEWNRRVVVQADHSISMPIVGNINVRGLNPKDIGVLVCGNLDKLIKDPMVFVCREIASTPASSPLR